MMEFLRCLDKSYPDMGYIFHSHTWSVLLRKHQNLLPLENANLSNIFTSISLIYRTLGYHPSSKQFFLNLWEGNVFSCVSMSVYETLDLTIKGPTSLRPCPQLPPRHLTFDLFWIGTPTPLTCSNFFNLDLTVKGPPTTLPPPLSPKVGKRVPHIPTGMHSCLWYTFCFSCRYNPVLTSGRLTSYCNAFLFVVYVYRLYPNTVRKRTLLLTAVLLIGFVRAILFAITKVHLKQN